MKVFGKKGKIIGSKNTTDVESVKGADVKILGTGCTKCITLANNAKEALSQLGMSTDIEKVTDMADIAAYGVMSTPALVYQNKVISYGKVLTVDQIKELL